MKAFNFDEGPTSLFFSFVAPIFDVLAKSHHQIHKLWTLIPKPSSKSGRALAFTFRSLISLKSIFVYGMGKLILSHLATIGPSTFC